MEQNKIAKMFFGFAVGPLGAAVINFITVPISTWLVSPEEYGKTSLFLIIQTLITSFVFLGMDQAYIRDYNSVEKKEKASFLITLISVPLIFGIILSLVGFISKDLLNLPITEIILLTIWIPFIIIERFLLLSIRMDGKGTLYSIFTILIRLVILIFTLILLLFFAQTYISILIAVVAGQIVVDLLLALYSLSVFKESNIQIKKSYLLKAFKYGIPFVPSLSILWVISSSDRIFLQIFGSYSELGIYLAALKIAGVFIVFQTIVTTFWMPVAYKWFEEQREIIHFEKANKLIAFVMSFIYLLLLTFKDVILFIFPPSYERVIDALPFLLIYPIMYTLSETTGIGISFSRRTSYNILISLITAIVTIILHIILVPTLGYIGTSMSIGISYCFLFWLKTIYSRILWEKFRVNYFICITLFLVISATINTLVQNAIFILLINLSLLIIFCLSNKSLIKELLLNQINPRFKFVRDKGMIK